MNLEHYVQRIESFLSATETDPETWARLANIMYDHTVLFGTRDNPFKGCSTKERFCEACKHIARKMCGSAAVFYEARYKDCLKECENYKASLTIDNPEDTEQVKRVVTEIKRLVDQTMEKFADTTILTAYAIENSFHLFYYADMIQQDSTYANDLCEKQQAYTNIRAALKQDAAEDFVNKATQAAERTETLLHEDFSKCIMEHTDILQSFPSFNASVSNLADNSLLKSFLFCGVILQWKTITNHACADRALCAILDKSASILNPAPMKTLTLSQMPQPPHFVNADMAVKGKKVAGKIAIGGAKIVGYTVLGIGLIVFKVLEKTTKFGLGFFIDIDDDDNGPAHVPYGHYGGV